MLSIAESRYARKTRVVPFWTSMLRKEGYKGVSFKNFKAKCTQYASGTIPANRNRDERGANPMMKVLMRILSPKGVRG